MFNINENEKCDVDEDKWQMDDAFKMLLYPVLYFDCRVYLNLFSYEKCPCPT